jgi:hypothetical protein
MRVARGGHDDVEGAQRDVGVDAKRLGSPNGQTPPTGWLVASTTSAASSIFAFAPKRSLYLRLSRRASPPMTIRIGSPCRRSDSVLAMRDGSTPCAAAASATVAVLEVASRISMSGACSAR